MDSDIVGTPVTSTNSTDIKVLFPDSTRPPSPTGKVLTLLGAERIGCAKMFFDFEADGSFGGFSLFVPRVRTTHVWCAVEWKIWGTIPSLKEMQFFDQGEFKHGYKHEG